MTTRRTHDAPPNARRLLLSGAGWVVLCALLAVAVTAAWVQDDQRRFASEWHDQAEALDERLRLAIDAYGFEQQRLLRLILNQPRLVEVLAALETSAGEHPTGAQDTPPSSNTAMPDSAIRAELIAALQPIWTALIDAHATTRLSIHTTDPPRVLLRMHDPERWGDNVDGERALPELVRTSGIALSGYEADSRGGAFRAAVPIFSETDPNRVIAIVEIGDPPDAAFAFFRQRSRSQLALFNTLATETRLNAFRTSEDLRLRDSSEIEGVGTLVGAPEPWRNVEHVFTLPSGSVVTEIHNHLLSDNSGKPTSEKPRQAHRRALWIPLHDFALGGNAPTTTGLEASAWIRATLDHLRVDPPPTASLRALTVGAVALALALLGLVALRARAQAVALQAAREATARRLEAVLEGADVGTWEWDIHNDTLTFDERARSWLATGDAPQTAPTPQPRTTWLERIDEPDRSALAEGLERLLHNPLSPLDVHFRIVRRGLHDDASANTSPASEAEPPVWLNLIGKVVEREAADRPLRAFGIVIDTTLEQLAQIKLFREASTDPLTGLLNRAHFLQMAEQARSVLARGGRGSVLVLFDLDHFKSINDRYGHDAGDDVLVTAARRVAEQLRPQDAIGRIGGEEFAILLAGCHDAERAANIVERLRAAIADDPVVTAQGQRIPVTASFGVANLYDAPVRDSLRQADAALYAAKHGGRNRIVFAPSEPAPSEPASAESTMTEPRASESKGNQPS